LYVANDFGRNCWYRNDGGRFTDVAAEANIEDIASGMSVTFSDFNHDGKFDIYVSNMFSTAGQRTTAQNHYKKAFASNDLSKLRRLARGNTLFRQGLNNIYVDVSLEANVNMGRWAWGSLFADVNNDSWDDLLVSNGFLSTSDTGDL
ncbi:MAG: VCBS repeat-containing protein, partial [Planctomycetales bacterium]|nr:VCBS repeat-containing protein [Planctomycetales bacterium]